MSSIDSPASDHDQWLESFWNGTRDLSTTAQHEMPRAITQEPLPNRLPLPSPGTVFMLVVALAIALRQRLRH